MIKKAVLVGCLKSPWVRIRDGYARPRLKVVAEAGIKLMMRTKNSGEISEEIEILSSGVFPIPKRHFVQVEVTEGNPQNVLCLLFADAIHSN